MQNYAKWLQFKAVRTRENCNLHHTFKKKAASFSTTFYLLLIAGTFNIAQWKLCTLNKLMKF